jgi:mannose-6-phosphate isomerase-like protein (cupin superfamily)
MVLSGTFELHISDKRFLLREGDSFSFPSTTPHHCRKPGRIETVIIWAFTLSDE